MMQIMLKTRNDAKYMSLPRLLKEENKKAHAWPKKKPVKKKEAKWPTKPVNQTRPPVKKPAKSQNPTQWKAVAASNSKPVGNKPIA